MRRDALIEGLNAEIHRALRPLLAGVRRVAPLGFPAHANLGDSAIWLGALACTGLARAGERS